MTDSDLHHDLQTELSWEAGRQDALQIDRSDVLLKPLDHQLGVQQVKTAPDPLQDMLFGDPALRAYCILDAATLDGIAEVLETCGLPHRCLFIGDAFDELQGVAPWIVQLQDGNAFARGLFTQGDAPWALWGKATGIYLISTASLEDIWRHFRKFSKVRDHTGSWHYMRFWDPQICVDLAECLTPENQRQFFASGLTFLAAIEGRLITMVSGQRT